jgi:hypothetical protein
MKEDNIFGDLVSTFEEDVSTQLPKDEELRDLKVLVWNFEVLTEEVAQIEQHFKKRKEELRKLQEETLPDKMLECGLSMIKTTSGKKLIIQKFYNAKIEPAFKESAFEWLREQGHDSVIKTNVTVAFDRGEDERAQHIYKLLIDADVPAKIDSNVHPMTLKALVKELVENGNSPPENIFNMYIGNRAVLK